METLHATPSLRDQQVASTSLARFTAALADKHAYQVKLRLQASEEAIVVPRKALELLQVILTGMAQGQDISLVVAEEQVSTQQAADMLQVSRPHLVKLLERNALPFTKVGSHRRLRLADVLAYKDQQVAQRQQHLRLLAEQAQELQLGYE
jgi:excisionase family DNA binding protein